MCSLGKLFLYLKFYINVSMSEDNIFIISLILFCLPIYALSLYKVLVSILDLDLILFVLYISSLRNQTFRVLKEVIVFHQLNYLVEKKLQILIQHTNHQIWMMLKKVLNKV